MVPSGVTSLNAVLVVAVGGGGGGDNGGGGGDWWINIYERCPVTSGGISFSYMVVVVNLQGHLKEFARTRCSIWCIN